MPELRIHAPAARFILQGGRQARSAAGDAFGVAMPEDACRANTNNGRSSLWLGPDEQLLIAPAADARDIAATLETALAGVPHSLVEVSQRQLAIDVNGPGASTMLNTGCPLDLDPAAFPPGMCTRTILGKAEIVLWRRSAEEYHLEIWRSYVDYVLAWMHEAQQGE